jgi:tRNA threonylcarbamoyladenosine biosynthesis protein TsaE
MNKLHFKCVTLFDLPQIAQAIVSSAQGYFLWCFEGEMGSGKTTLIQAICQQLQVSSDVTSPTFSLVNEYATHNGNVIYHFDFYRIRNIEEAYDIGYEEYFYSYNICLIEWPNLIKELLANEPIVHIKISKNADHSRTIEATLGLFPQ